MRSARVAPTADAEARAVKFARRVYTVAAVYGVMSLVPGFFTVSRFETLFPPILTHPEFYYGFYGLALVWQFAFFVIARDPARLVTMMPVTVLEKAAWAITVTSMVATDRTARAMLITGGIDAVLGVFFTIAYVRLINSGARVRH
jgi:hypothetical protein